jgi:hypothetical protein
VLTGCARPGLFSDPEKSRRLVLRSLVELRTRYPKLREKQEDWRTLLQLRRAFTFEELQYCAWCSPDFHMPENTTRETCDALILRRVPADFEDD